MSSSNQGVTSILQNLFSELAIAFDSASKALQNTVPVAEVNELSETTDVSLVVEQNVHDPAVEYPEESSPVHDNYHELKKDELKDLCRSRGILISGSKWDLVTRLVAYDTSKPKAPAESIASFDLLFFDRQSNSSKDWNPKCHSGQSMKLFLHVCKTKRNGTYIVTYCQCKKQVLNGMPQALLPSIEGENTVLFKVADTNQMWKDYICNFKATFTTKEDADCFKTILKSILEVDEMKLCSQNDEFQSQNWY